MANISGRWLAYSTVRSVTSEVSHSCHSPTPRAVGGVMRILIAGASGALGKRLVPLLVQAGHEIIGTTRSDAKPAELKRPGAHPLTVNALDRDAVRQAVAETKPEVVVHQLTAIASKADFGNLDRYFAA